MEHKFFEASKAMQEGKECAHVDDVEIEMRDEPKKKAGDADDNPEQIDADGGAAEPTARMEY
jgi:hypothetical protein